MARRDGRDDRRGDEQTAHLGVALQRAFRSVPCEVCVFWSPKSTNLVRTPSTVQFEDSQVRADSAKPDLVRELLGRDAMRPAVWLCLAIPALLSIAHAEPRRTIEAATLRKKPGEHEAAVAQLPAHTPVTVLGLEGRWLRVRALSVEGFLTRTQVSEADAASAPAMHWRAPDRRAA